MKNSTAVEWLEKEIIKRFKRSNIHYTDSEWTFEMIKKLSHQAKEMEKQQIIDAFETDNMERKDWKIIKLYGEQYYNGTFKTK